MGRTVIVDDAVQNFLRSLVTGKLLQSGLIIGQATAAKDYVIHLATTPKQDVQGSVPSINIPPDLSPTSAVGGSLPAGIKDNRVKTEDDLLDEKWISQHVKQVTRMLPGGLDVLGIFVAAPADVLQSLQLRFRQVIIAISRLLNKQRISIQAADEPTHRLVLQVCSTSGKHSCRSVPVSDPTSDAKPADLKFQSISSKWHQINTKLSIDWRVPISIETLATSLMKQLQAGLHPFCIDIWNSLALFDGAMRDDDEHLTANAPAEGSRGKKSRNRLAESLVIEVDLYSQTMEGKKMTKPLVCECGAMLSIRGNVHGRAYVHSKASVKEAVKALKTDLVRTLVSRCVILCEDESIYEHEQDPSTVLETPMRVFVPLPGTNLTVCDYIFNGESSADSVEPFKELLGIDVSSEKVESDCESFPGEEDLQDEQLSRCSSESELEIVKQQARSYLWVLVSVLVAIGAVVASYFYLRIPERDDKK